MQCSLSPEGQKQRGTDCVSVQFGGAVSSSEKASLCLVSGLSLLQKHFYFGRHRASATVYLFVKQQDNFSCKPDSYLDAGKRYDLCGFHIGNLTP